MTTPSMPKNGNAHNNAESPGTAAQWSRQNERSSLGIVRFMVWLSLTLGRRCSRAIVYGIAAYFFVFSTKARKASRGYLQRVLQRPVTAGDGYRHFLSFASCIHDRVYWLSDRHDLFDVELRGVEHVLAITQPAANTTPNESGRGIVFVGAHLGSFESMRMLGATHGLQVRMLMYPDNSRKLTSVLASINSSVLDSIIALGHPDSLLKVRDCLEQAESVGALADRHLQQESGVVFDFLGGQARFPDGPFRMAAMLKAPVIFMTSLYLGNNRYRIELIPLADFSAVSAGNRAQAIAQAQQNYVQTLEQMCHSAPMNWFNFYDFWHDTIN